MGVTVLVAGRMRLHREALAAALRGREGIDVVGTAAVDDAVSEVDIRGPDVVVLDAVTRDVVAAVAPLAAQAKVIAIVVDRSFAACAAAGISGFVTPESSPDELATAIEAVAGGGMVFAPTLADALLRVLATARNEDSGVLETLTCREREVLAAAADGLSNKQIAARLGLEVQTVKNYVHRILVKLAVADRRDAVAVFHAAT